MAIIPARTQRRFNVYTTYSQRYGRFMGVETMHTGYEVIKLQNLVFIPNFP